MKERKEEMQVSASATKRPWKKMELSYLGNAVELIQMPGGGKISSPAGDPGDPRKQPSG
jgi:hypothetical protein